MPSAKRLAQQGAQTAATTASDYGDSATSANAQLTPFFSQEMHAQHEFNPSQINEMLTAADAGAGSATGTEQAKLEQEAARTHNDTGLGKSLEDIARDKSKAAAGIGESVAAQDVMGAEKLRQEGAAGMSGLYNTDTNAQLKAMGVETGDINAETAAGGGGLMQTLGQGMNLLKQGASLFSPLNQQQSQS